MNVIIFRLNRGEDKVAGTKAGGLKAARTNKLRHGDSFYKNIGARGGRAGNTGGFASLERGIDGRTGPERARIVGSIGGKVSKRRRDEKAN